VKFGHVVFEVCEWTNRPAGRHTCTVIAILSTPSRVEVNITEYARIAISATTANVKPSELNIQSTVIT